LPETGSLRATPDPTRLVPNDIEPQIAGKADAHYFVYKEIVKDKVKTNIRPLTTDERITTIAKMLSGEKPTAAAIENAREMVGN